MLLCGNKAATERSRHPDVSNSSFPRAERPSTPINAHNVAQEIVDWLAKPENLQNSDSLPPFIESFDAAPYLSAALPLAGSVLALNLAHEAVQRAVAASKGVTTKTLAHNSCLSRSQRAHGWHASPRKGPMFML